jgi:hypothetical protein
MRKNIRLIPTPSSRNPKLTSDLVIPNNLGKKLSNKILLSSSKNCQTTKKYEYLRDFLRNQVNTKKYID